MGLLNVGNFFDIERMRTDFALRGDLESFKLTYLKDPYQIRDSNDSKFWDNLLTQSQNCIGRSPIYIDKKRKISSFFWKKKGKLLSVGFGTGAIEKEIKKLNNEIELFGIDISKKAVDDMSNAMVGCFKDGNILKIPFKSLFFDFILALDILEHIPPIKIFKVYKELFRVLKKGGILVLSVPLNENLESMVKEGRNPNSHLRAYSPEILKTELKIFNFVVVKEIYLYAFRKFYLLKTLLVKVLHFLKIRNPNLLVIVAQKR